MSFIVPSPAKINLFLHIIGRRSDGYHLLQTAFQFIDFCDEMIFEPRKDSLIALKTNLPNLTSEDNLITKAARLLQKMTQSPCGITIELKKKIPIGAGLGGGSSNAATTLLILNQLWELHLSKERLAQIGLTLGADIPIFILGKAAFAEGIGEILHPLALSEPWVLLVLPHCNTPTSKIFSDSQLTRNTRAITIDEFFANGGKNDCEPIAKKHFPEIAYALECLNQYSAAKMTGTGSAVFATFEDKETAERVAVQLPKPLNGILVKGLNNSPLHETMNHLFGVSPSGKAQGFDPCIPRFES